MSKPKFTQNYADSIKCIVDQYILELRNSFSEAQVTIFLTAFKLWLDDNITPDDEMPSGMEMINLITRECQEAENDG